MKRVLVELKKREGRIERKSRGWWDEECERWKREVRMELRWRG